jgi:hypothetical protein
LVVFLRKLNDARFILWPSALGWIHLSLVANEINPPSPKASKDEAFLLIFQQKIGLKKRNVPIDYQGFLDLFWCGFTFELQRVLHDLCWCFEVQTGSWSIIVSEEEREDVFLLYVSKICICW